MKLTDISTIKTLFEKHGFSFTKSLGQNFLINPSVCPKIAQLGGAGENVGAIEIGTGIGVLTRELSARCKKVVAIEIDKTLKPILDETLADCNNTEVIFADVMETDLKKLIEEHFSGMEVIVCANLPYYITTPIVMRFVEGDVRPVSMSVMVQKEVAGRLAAAPGTADYGAITASVALCCDVRITRFVPRSLFTPPPNVDSSVVRLDFVDKMPREEEQKTRRLIGAAFAMRRKTLVNNLARCGYAKEAVAAALEKMGLRADVRGETLSYLDFAKLQNLLSV